MIRAAALALSLAAAPLAAAVPGVQPRAGVTALLTPEAFREAVAAAVGKLRPGAIIKRTGNQDLTVTEAGREEVKIYTGNAYTTYLGDSASLTAIVERHARLLSDVSGADDAKLDRLVVIVRPADYVSAAFGPSAGPGTLIAPRPLAGDLAYFLGVDSPETIRTATTDDLTRWKISVAEAWASAVANTPKRLGEVGIGALEDDQGGAAAIGAASGLAPSLLADPNMCGPAFPTGLQQQVVFVMNKEVYLFGNPAEADMMTALWRSVKQLTASGTPFSKTPLTCRDGRWVAVPVP